MKSLTINSFLGLLLSTAITPIALAETPRSEVDTRIEKYENLTETETGNMTSQEEMNSDMNATEPAEDADYRAEEKLREAQSSDIPSDYYQYDVRRTEAFNLVSSAYRGQFETQGIDGYAVMLSNYNSGELTAESLIQAAIQSGELSPMALEDDSYVEAVQLQLDALASQ